jgi:hypothetical protein
VLPTVFKRLTTEWKKRGTRLDIGKSCLRIASWEKCEPDLIAEAIASVPMKQFVAATNAATSTRKKNTAKKKAVKKKPTAKKTTRKSPSKKTAAKTKSRNKTSVKKVLAR